MAEKMFMRVDEVAEAMDVSIPYAFKVIRRMNTGLKEAGCITIDGRVDRKYFRNSFTAPEITKGGDKMPAYRMDNGKWYAICWFMDWQGSRRQKCKKSITVLTADGALQNGAPGEGSGYFLQAELI